MDLVDRLFDRLRAAIAADAAGAAPPTVADVYQRLIPYRAVRGELGILALAEYEHALMRLLSGERGLLVVASESARDELARELASPNPIVGVYRDYAALPVTLLAGGAPGAPGAGLERGGGREGRCARCGAPLRDEWNFCTRCGSPRLDVAPRA